MKMTTTAILATSALALSSCASIISGSSNPIIITSTPAAATFTITDRAGKVIHSGTTPETVTLEAGQGYFTAARYDIALKKDGYPTKTYPVIAGLNGWYFANLLFGGLIGMLIVDPITGAMYKLPKNVVVPLDGPQASGPGPLNIVTIDAVPDDLRDQLIGLN